MSNATKITTAEQAVSVLIQAAKIGQSKGAYSFEDAAMIAQGIAFLTNSKGTQEPQMQETNAPEAQQPNITAQPKD